VLRAPQVQEPFSGGADPINAFKKVTKIRPLRFASPSYLDLADKAERTLFIKDLAIAGALMVIAAGASRV
jgi:hypothetical protein